MYAIRSYYAARHRSRARAHHPAADRRRLRLEARYLSLRADRDLSRQDHRPAGEARVHARRGISRLADAPALV